MCAVHNWILDWINEMKQAVHGWRGTGLPFCKQIENQWRYLYYLTFSEDNACAQEVMIGLMYWSKPHRWRGTRLAFCNQIANKCGVTWHRLMLSLIEAASHLIYIHVICCFASGSIIIWTTLLATTNPVAARSTALIIDNPTDYLTSDNKSGCGEQQISVS